MLYLSHLLPPTSIRRALKCDFIQSGVDCLIIGKHHLIEVHGLDPAVNAPCLYKSAVFDVVEHINFYKKSNDPTATLLVLTSNLQLFTLKFCPTSDAIITTASISLDHHGSRLADHLQTSVVDPHGRCVIAHVLSGILHVIPLIHQQPSKNNPTASKRSRSRRPSTDATAQPNIPNPKHSHSLHELAQIFQLPLSELHVHSINFTTLPASYHPTLLIIHTNHLGDRVLRVRKIDLQAKLCDQDLSKKYTCRNPLTKLIIPLCMPDSLGNTTIKDSGALLIGEESAELVHFTHSLLDNLKEEPMTTKPRPDAARKNFLLSAYTRIPLGVYNWGKRKKELHLIQNFILTGSLSEKLHFEFGKSSWILGDLYGNLINLRLEPSSNSQDVTLTYRHLGHVPSPEALVYISHGLLWLASHYGDSQLLQFSPEIFSSHHDGPSPITPKVVDERMNLAPISDFCISEDRQSRANQIVTCSGAYRDGSLRIMQYGLGSRESQSLDIAGVQRVWTLKSSTLSESPGDFHDRIILSCAYRTRLLALNDDGTIEELGQLDGFRTDTPSILAGNLNDCYLSNHRYSIQVTPQQVIAREALRWESEGGEVITGAAIGSSLCIICLKCKILFLRIKNGSIIQEGPCHVENEISSVAIGPRGKFVAVAQWISNIVQIISVETQTKICEITTGSQSMINSLTMCNFGPTVSDECKLLIGLSDSKVINLSLDSNGRISPKYRFRTTVLGTRPIQFVPVSSTKSAGTVWAISDHPVAIHASMNSGKLAYRPILVQGGPILAASGLEAKFFPNRVVLAFEKEIRIEQLYTTHLSHKKIPLGNEQPKRIAYSAAIKAFVVICTRSEIDPEARLGITGSLKIFDDETFKLLFNFPLLPSEQGLSILTLEHGKSGHETLVVGTGTMKSHRGRILAIGEVLEDKPRSKSRRFNMINSTELSSPVGGLGALPNGMFVASSNGYVHAYGTTQVDEGDSLVGRRECTLKIELLDSWGNGFLSPAVVTNGTKVLVADDYKSIIALEFDLDQLRFIMTARDPRSMSVRRIGMISNADYIACDDEFNLFTLKDKKGEKVAPLVGSTTSIDHGEEFFRDGVDHEDDDDDDYSEIYEPNWLDHNCFNRTGDHTNQKPTTAPDDLFHTAAFHLGENVNQFRAGSLVPKCRQSNQLGQTKLIFVTSTGGIGSIIHVKQSNKRMERIFRVQVASSQVVSSLGNLNHTTFRELKTKTTKIDSMGFLDGRYLKSYLEMCKPPGYEPETVQQVHLQSTTTTVDTDQTVSTQPDDAGGGKPVQVWLDGGDAGIVEELYHLERLE